MLKVDRPKKNSFRPNFYSKDEVQQLLEVSQDDPLHLCILITAYYGLRRSEVLGLKWSSIDFERKSITINHKVTEQLVNGKYVPVVSDVMKNKTSCRTLPLIPAVEEELLKRKEKQLCRKKRHQPKPVPFVGGDGGILPRAKQQPAGLIACGLRTAALFSSAPSWPQKRHQPEPVPFVGGDGGIRTHVPG